MKRILLSIAILLCCLVRAADERATDERLSFQTNGPWSPRVHLNADVAMVYGIGARLADMRIVMRSAARTAPTEILVFGKPAARSQYDYSDGTLRLRFANSAEGVPVEVRW
jgi:hypothetical protein